MAAKSSSKRPDRHREHAEHPWKRVPKPTFRSLKVYGIDPSAGSAFRRSAFFCALPRVGRKAIAENIR